MKENWSTVGFKDPGFELKRASKASADARGMKYSEWLRRAIAAAVKADEAARVEGE